MADDAIETDILIVGGGPAGLTAAIHARKTLREQGSTAGVMVLEKGAYFGAHSVSGAIVPDDCLSDGLSEDGAKAPSLGCAVADERLLLLTRRRGFTIPWGARLLSSQKSRAISLGDLVQRLARDAEDLGVDLLPGFSGREVLFHENTITGIRTGAKGMDRHGQPRANYEPETTILAKVTILAEGSSGHLARTVVARLGLAANRPLPVYALGFKELWQVERPIHSPGAVMHTLGHPLDAHTYGGGFVYFLEGGSLSIGFVVGLDYRDARFDPLGAFQKFKSHPRIQDMLAQGRRLGFGAHLINEGGWYSIPRPYGDGVLIAGEDAGYLNARTLKGIPLALRTGALAGTTAARAVLAGDTTQSGLRRYEEDVAASGIRAELRRVRNFRQAMGRGWLWGLPASALQMITGGRGLRDPYPATRGMQRIRGASFAPEAQRDDHAASSSAALRSEAVYATRTVHEEDQPSHLVVPEPELCAMKCREEYDHPCVRFCPAGVYGIEVQPDGGRRLIVQASNCIHCKTCSVADPYGGITWLPPEGGSGPRYDRM